MTQKNPRAVAVGSRARPKPSTKLVLVSREPLLYLEFNKLNKHNYYEVNLFKKFNFFLSLKIIVDTLIDARNETQKHVTLLSDANVPVRFRAQ